MFWSYIFASFQKVQKQSFFRHFVESNPPEWVNEPATASVNVFGTFCNKQIYTPKIKGTKSGSCPRWLFNYNWFFFIINVQFPSKCIGIIKNKLRLIRLLNFRSILHCKLSFKVALFLAVRHSSHKSVDRRSYNKHVIALTHRFPLIKSFFYKGGSLKVDT